MKRNRMIILLTVITFSLISAILILDKPNSVSLYRGKTYKPEYCSMICKDCSNTNFAILFTTHITKKREKMYNDVIEYWLTDCKFPKEKIFLVDSANRGIDSSLIPLKNQVIFDQKVECSKILHDKSKIELFSIKKAINELNFGDVKYIFKITGKYKLPELCDIKLDSDLIIQNQKKKLLSKILPFTEIINTEIIGFRKELFSNIIDKLYNEQGFELEKKLHNFVKNNQNITIQYLPKLINDGRYNRGDTSYLKYL